MAANNMHNLTTLIKRLEAATSRLEDMASSIPESATSANPGLPSGAAVPLPPISQDEQAGSTKELATPPAPELEAFDELMKGDLQAYVNMSEKIGGLVAEQSASVVRAFAAERDFITMTTKTKKPEMTSPEYMEMLKDIQATIGAVNDIRVANRGSPLENHLMTVSEGIVMLGWVTVTPKPADFVTEALNAAQFYGNRVYKEHKDKDQAHVEWVRGFYRIFPALSAYVKTHYPSGMTWNNDGIEPTEALRRLKAGEALGTPSGPAAPPPPPPLPTFDQLSPPTPALPEGGSSRGVGGSDMSGVFSQLSKGESVTSGLRKVDPSQQTHKNPTLRAGSTVPQRSDSLNSDSSSMRGKSPAPSKRPKPESMRTKKPPRKELEGTMWFVENFDSPSDGPIEIDAKINHSILVTRCNNVTLIVKNKANAISIDSSTKVALVIDSLVSSVDIIKTSKIDLQVLGVLPTVLMDQVDGANIYLSKESLGTEIFTSKSTAVNINVPGKNEEDDYKECAVPEQIKTVIKNGVAVSEIVEHAG